ncbi:MAG TPA: hypothetical protein VJQ43_05710, partial [Thermoplasmata archaeon]|nr:hypothetical protein [Thermoplasmata archaeon]
MYGTGIGGATVSISSATGPCTNCGSAVTNATGAFQVAGDAGPAVLQVHDIQYLDNRTFPTVVFGVVTSVGTIFLVHFATVQGKVRADLPGTPALDRVSVSSVTRDGGLTGPTSNFTDANGTFNLSVDPIPIEIDFAPPNQTFLVNETWVDPTPWQSVDLGTILLEGGVVLNMSVVDAVTGAAVAADASFCSDRISNGCLNAGNGTPGSVEFPAVAGPGFASIAAPGYVTNVTQMPDVPSGTAGPIHVGTARLVPVGTVEITVNFTGGTPDGTWPSALTNESSTLDVIICSLSGDIVAGTTSTAVLSPSSNCLDTPVSLGQTVLVAAPPLRDIVMIARDPLGYPVPRGFPLAELPLPELLNLKRFLNETWANVTPDAVTYLGSVDVSAGTYLSGAVTVSGSFASNVTSSASITVCSTVRPTECEPGVQTGPSGQTGPIPVGCPTSAWTFCAPAPPGPDHVTITWGPAVNGTWITVPHRCCGQQGHPTPIGTFGLTANVGAVHGTVGVEGAPVGTVPASFGAGIGGGVSVCPSDLRNAECFQGTYDPLNGTFSLIAPLGWDVVTASQFHYRSNSTWIDVTGNNSTGLIEIGPVAFVGGQVLSASTGYPLLEAQITACAVANPNACSFLGTTYGSNGTFNGTLSAVPYPGSAYMFSASASGYDAESTFVNVTPGAVTTVPTMRLAPVGVSA